MKYTIFVLIAGILLSLPGGLAAQSSESRYNKEFVFALYMTSISFGASPVILHDFMFHTHANQGVSITLPQLHFMFDRCGWDFDNAGSVGWGFFLAYGRYRFGYAANDGRGDDPVGVQAGMLQAFVGPTYHYTIRTSLEAYFRPMIGIVMSGFKYSNVGSDYDLVSNVIWNGVVGMRYFFSNRFGVYVEGGYTSGLVNAGITYSW